MKMEVWVSVGATAGIVSSARSRHERHRRAWSCWPTMTGGRRWRKGKMSMVGRLEGEKEKKRKREIGKKGGAVDRRRWRKEWPTATLWALGQKQ